MMEADGGETLDDTGVKKIILAFEKKALKNQVPLFFSDCLYSFGLLYKGNSQKWKDTSLLFILLNHCKLHRLTNFIPQTQV